MTKAIFPSFKFLSLDYVHENVTRQKLAVSWMLIPFPKGILHNEDYCHRETFVNDLYRRPWKRSIPACTLQEDNLDVLKEYASNAEFLEKFSIKEEPLDFVPSSNPHSPIKLKDICSFNESSATDLHTHEECWKTIPSNDLEGNFLPEEVVLVDYLAQFGQHIPKLSTLKSRLKTFSVQDPLIDLNKDLSSKDILFRMDKTTEQNVDQNKKLEEFYVLPTIQEELQHLSLPCSLESHTYTRESTIPELIVQLAPEKLLDVEELKNTLGSPTKMSPKNDLIEHNTTNTKMDLCNYEDVLDTVCFRSYNDAELEPFLTPPCSDTAAKTCAKLTAEELSPISPTSNFYITDPGTDILESLEWNTDIKLFFLKVPRVHSNSQRLTIEELKEKLSVNPDTSVDVTLEDNWWSQPNNKYKKSLEVLSANVPSTHSLTPTTMESINPITSSQLERMLEEKACSVEEKTSLQYHRDHSNSHDSKIILMHPPLQKNVNVPFAVTPCTVETTHLLTHRTEKKQLDTSECSSKVELQLNQDLMSTPSSARHLNLAQKNPSVQKCLSSSSNSPRERGNSEADLLSSFIALRTKSGLNATEQIQRCSLEANGAQSIRSEYKENSAVSCDTIPLKKPSEDSKHHTLTLHVTPSESQCHAYRVLQAEAVPVLKKLIECGVPACREWNFVSVSFDSTRFLLRQQEKTISNSSKIGHKSDNDMMIFKNAALLHILVTLRDIILTCTLDAALEYLYKANHMYKSALGPCLEDLWRKLRIVQFVRDKSEEMNPKMAALLQWMENESIEHKQFKVLILTQLESETINQTLNNVCSKTNGLKAIILHPASGNTFLQPEVVLDSLAAYFFFIINNRHIGSNFPWAYFSFVIEYDSTDCWLKLCQDLNIFHMTLKTCLPKAVTQYTTKDIEKDFLSDIRVPYVFLSSEELINTTEILQILESRYNMTFIERGCCASLQHFGKTNHCAMITVDVSTVILLQGLDGLTFDKSAENLILKIVALSLQYSYCWILLYSNQSSHSEYNLSGDILHNVTLIYAAIVQLTSKSEDFEIKVLISPGVDQTGTLIHVIIDQMLMMCNGDPYMWLDKSWLSVLISKEENILLTFPCINPMVAQLMLSRGLTLEWLLSATNDQLEELFPEVPSKILKHFTSITALHHLKKSTPSPKVSHRPSSTSLGDSSSVEDSFINVNNRDVHNLHQSGHIQMCNDIWLEETKTVCRGISEPLQFYKNDVCQPEENDFQIKVTESKNNILQLQLSSFSDAEHCTKGTTFAPPVEQGDIFSPGPLFLKFSKNQTKPVAESDFEQHMSTYINENPAYSDFSSGEDSFLQGVFSQPCLLYNSLENQTSWSFHDKHICADILAHQNLPNPPNCTTDSDSVTRASQQILTEKQRESSGIRAFNSLHFSQRGFVANKRIMGNSIAAGKANQVKRRKLTYEKVPGRCDGQTRLKFF